MAYKLAIKIYNYMQSRFKSCRNGQISLWKRSLHTKF